MKYKKGDLLIRNNKFSSDYKYILIVSIYSNTFCRIKRGIDVTPTPSNVIYDYNYKFICNNYSLSLKSKLNKL